MTPAGLTSWSVILAVVFYFLSTGLCLVDRRESGRGFIARWTWTAGCAMLMVHVVFAFAFYHDWSHAAAYLATAEKTRRVIGLDWGGGLYVNGLMIVLWTIDVAWWWIRPETYRGRLRWIDLTLHAFFLFMIFNATVVFETGPIGWLGIVGCGVIAVLAWQCR